MRLPRPVLACLVLPLLVPQIAFLFGIEVALLMAGAQPGFLPVALVHALFVAPYTVLALADPWFALDPRYEQVAASLGRRPLAIFLGMALFALTAFATGEIADMRRLSKRASTRATADRIAASELHGEAEPLLEGLAAQFAPRPVLEAQIEQHEARPPHLDRTHPLARARCAGHPEPVGGEVVGQETLGRLVVLDDQDQPVALLVHADPSDMGRLIGKRGRVVQALRQVTRAAGAAEGIKVSVDIIE